MSREVYAYSKLNDFPNCFFFEEIKGYPQITVTTDLRKAIQWNYVDFNVRDFRQVLDAIIPSWTTDQAKFQESVLLSEFFREKIANEDDKEVLDWLSGCKKNIPSLLSAIILLEEADLKPDDLINSNDKNIELMIEAWQFLLKNDISIMEYHEGMKVLNNEISCKNMMANVFNMNSIDTIVFHGFYYFTPIQERVINAIEEAGVRLIFLIQYDERYPFVHEIWDKTYSVDYGYVSKDEWEICEGSETDVLGEIFEGRASTPTNSIRIRKYTSVIEFVDAMKKAKKQKYSIYASDYSQANKILKEFYPEEYGERKLLSYPIGRFVYELNRMWDDNLQDIVLDEDSLMTCFASGWIAYDGKPAKDYLQDLKYIMPYFKGCVSIKEWRNRMAYLEQIHDDVITPFREYEQTGDRWQAVAGNPFLNFSIFAVPKQRLHDILKMMEQLMDMAELLFEKDKAVSVRSHINKLEWILKNNERSNELYSKEREIVQEIFDKLNAPSKFDSKCFPGDVATALLLYLEGSFEDEEQRSRGVGMVYPLFQVDAAGIKNLGKVHLCLCDVDRMPGRSKKYVWPLSETVIRNCKERTNNRYLNVLIDVMDAAPIANRYFMYSALSNPDVVISWIENLNGKPLAPSPYIRLLEIVGNIKINSTAKWEIDYKRVSDTPMEKSLFEHYVRVREDAPKEVMMDYAVCPMRYLLGYVLEQYPTYQTTFLQNYSINGLVTAIYFLMRDQGCTTDDVYKEVIKLFPHLRPVEKRQILDYLSIGKDRDNPDLGQRSAMNDLYYTDERLKLKYPNKSFRVVADELYAELLSPDGTTGMNVHSPSKYRDACVFCQHAEYCKNAVYALDQEAYYD